MTACRHVQGESYRIVPGRHLDGCADECRGCQPCTETHCLVCAKEHARTVCPECVGHTRADLTQVAELAAHLREQAGSIGLPDATAPMTLMGPAADFEAWAHQRMSVLRASNYDAPLDDLDGDPEPVLFTLGSWANLYREVLDKPTDLRQTGRRDLAFLLENLHVMADRFEPPFSDFAADIRRARGRLEDCLRDGERNDPAGVACFDCGGSLERRAFDPSQCRHETPARTQIRRDVNFHRIGYPEMAPPPHSTRPALEPCGECSQGGHDDRWTCKRCRRQYTDPEYHLAVRAAIEQEASA